jgi:DNA-binding NarL/FixJ family response regulator
MLDNSVHNGKKTESSRYWAGKELMVLVAVDDAVRTFTLSTILTKTGFTNISICDEFAALELAKLTQPRLLIADASLPGTTGIHLAIAVKRAVPRCGVNLLAEPGAENEVRATMRILDYEFSILYKPVQPANLLSCVRECLATPRTMATPWGEKVERITINNNLPIATSGRVFA